MSLLFLISKALLILFFLVMFLRTNKPAWGIGLLTVTSAILLDTFLSTLGREQMLEELGFFIYVIAGALVAGAAIWLGATLKEFVFIPDRAQNIQDDSPISDTVKDELSNPGQDENEEHRLIFEELHMDLTYDDQLDLMFELGWTEEDVVNLHSENDQFSNSIINLAEDRHQIDNMRLAIERIISPIPPENLPRLEKLKQDSPPTVLRHYLLNNYTMGELDQIIIELDADEDIDSSKNKNAKVRYLLMDLYQYNRIDALIKIMQAGAKGDENNEHRVG